MRNDGGDPHLGRTEFPCFDSFMAAPGRVFHREQFADTVLGSACNVKPVTVDVMSARLRRALRQDGGRRNPIRTSV